MNNSRLVENYYRETVKNNNKEELDDFLKQVGKTFLGKTINEGMFNIILNSVKENLDINKNDVVLDLGCANGLITHNIALDCLKILGYDLSKDLIDTAKKHHSRKNVTYINNNILNIDIKKTSIQKIYMYEVIQHLNYKELRKLLIEFNEELGNFTFFIGSIPDAEKLLQFYNTKERKKYYFNEVLENGKFHIGNWWYKEQLEYLCEDLDLECKMIKQNSKLHTSHYRFDCLIKR
jgi:cyclopropane fatty-acyl-phospholipid synthase-like methyltransferase